MYKQREVPLPRVQVEMLAPFMTVPRGLIVSADQSSEIQCGSLHLFTYVTRVTPFFVNSLSCTLYLMRYYGAI